MKNSIGKSYEGKLHPRIAEGGNDRMQIIVIFTGINWSMLSGSTLLANAKKQNLNSNYVRFVLCIFACNHFKNLIFKY